MTAEEIRDESRNNFERFTEVNLDSKEAIVLVQYAAQMEIAAQLAELNERLRTWTTKN